MPGGFVLVVGPSGAGKDTLIRLVREGLAPDPRFLFPRRLVTRPTSAWEDHDTIDRASFASAEAAGRFCLSWPAHGLSYAIPAEAGEAARLGRIVVCNVSRTVLDEARRRLPGVAVVEVTAPIEILVERLVARGRDDPRDVRRRILRSRHIGETRADLTIVNDRTPQEGAAALVSFLRDRAGAAGSNSGG